MLMYIYVHLFMCLHSHSKYMCLGMHIYDVPCNCGMSSETASTAFLFMTQGDLLLHSCVLPSRLFEHIPLPVRCVYVCGLYVSPPTGDRMWSGVFDITVLNHKHGTSGCLPCSPASGVQAQGTARPQETAQFTDTVTCVGGE